MAQDVHSLALNAERSLEALATALAHEGADQEATKAVTSMAEVMRKVVSALGQGQEATPPPQGAPGPQPETVAGGVAGVHQDMQAAAAPQR